VSHRPAARDRRGRRRVPRKQALAFGGESW